MTKTISRYFDIIVYSFLSWLIFSIASEIGIVKSFINNWLSIYDSTSYYFSIFIYCLAGMLTKFTLINSGDFNYRHTFYNEGIYRNKDESSIFSIGYFDLKIKLRQAIVNPPLRLSIVVFLTIIYSTSNIELKNYFTIEFACYLIGLNIPHLFKSIKSSLAQPMLDGNNEELNTEHWHQYEKPVSTLNQDRLNRGELVNRLFNVITSSENADTRGIAIIGPFGIGKSSVINMTLSEIQMAFHSYIPCRINSWGTYSSEEQIQKHLIEQVINSLGKVTSTTSLSGLPSKYIHTLKGAQSLWLDILPIFDNHSSPDSQLAEIDDLLAKLKLKIIIIIEDLDRNKDAEAMLNSIAPLIDKLNEKSSFRFILSIGQKLNNPGIINRICRYKEYINLDRDHVQKSIENCLNKMVKMKELTYTGHFKNFFSTTTASGKTSTTRDALLSYITNPRELKVILRQVELDWNNSLHGCCDILDLFAITTLMHYEPILITSMLNHNSSEISFTKLTEKNKELMNELSSAKSSEIIVNYFFDTTREDTKPENRLQSCRHDFNKYFQLIVARNRIDKEQREREQSYFSGLFELNLLCKKNSLPNEIYTLTDELTYYKNDYDKFIYDYKALYGKNSLIPTLILIKYLLLNKGITINDRAISDYLIGKIKGSRVKNHTLAHSIIRDIVNFYLNQSLLTLKDFYEKLEGSINRNYIPKPKISTVMLKFKEQNDNKEVLNMHLIDAALNIIQFVISKNSTPRNNKPQKNKYEFFVEWLIYDKSIFSMKIIDKIKENKPQDNFSVEYYHIRSLQEHLKSLTKPIKLIKETEKTI